MSEGTGGTAVEQPAPPAGARSGWGSALALLLVAALVGLGFGWLVDVNRDRFDYEPPTSQNPSPEEEQRYAQARLASLRVRAGANLGIAGAVAGLAYALAIGLTLGGPLRAVVGCLLGPLVGGASLGGAAMVAQHFYLQAAGSDQQPSILQDVAMQSSVWAPLGLTLLVLFAALATRRAAILPLLAAATVGAVLASVLVPLIGSTVSPLEAWDQVPPNNLTGCLTMGLIGNLTLVGLITWLARPSTPASGPAPLEASA